MRVPPPASVGVIPAGDAADRGREAVLERVVGLALLDLEPGVRRDCRPGRRTARRRRRPGAPGSRPGRRRRRSAACRRAARPGPARPRAARARPAPRGQPPTGPGCRLACANHRDGLVVGGPLSSRPGPLAGVPYPHRPCAATSSRAPRAGTSSACAARRRRCRATTPRRRPRRRPRRTTADSRARTPASTCCCATAPRC